MKLTKWIPILITAVIVWTIFILTCAKVSAHDTVKIRDGKEVHDAKQEREMNAERGKDSHWHFGETQFGAWDRCIADTYDEENHEYRPEMCDEEQSSEPDPPPQPKPEPPPPPQPKPRPKPQNDGLLPPSPPLQNDGLLPPPPNTTRTASPRRETRMESTDKSLLDYIARQDRKGFDVECEIEDTVEVIFDHGFSFHTLLVALDGVNTVADLWQYYDFLKEYDDTMSLLINGTWWRYDGDDDGIVGKVWLTPHMAIVIDYDGLPLIKELTGCRIPNQALVEIKAGFNFIGFPYIPDGYSLPSDFLSDNVSVVEVALKGDWKWIEEAGDSGDVPLRDGQGLGFISSKDFEIQLTAPDLPQAPMAQRGRILTTTWGAMKR